MHLTLSMMAFLGLSVKLNPRKKATERERERKKESTERLYMYVRSREIAIEKERMLIDRIVCKRERE